jgi:RimJ/RimL family protein N-acetyltransferase
MAFGHWMEINETTDAGDVRLRLGPIRRDDAKLFVSADAGFGMQSYEVSRYLGMGPPPTEEGEIEWWDEQSKNKDILSWGVYVPNDSTDEDAPEWKLIGSTALFFRQHDRRRAESGFMLFRREHWGKRIASTAHLGRTLYAFDELGLIAITSQAFSPNAGSNRALQGIGYVQTGTLYHEAIVNGKVVDSNVYLMPNPDEVSWRFFWRRPDTEIPQPFLDGRALAQRSMDRARAAVTFL